jgi:hypothetical protein
MKVLNLCILLAEVSSRQLTGSSPTINGLVGISHYGDTAGCFGETLHELILRCVRILYSLVGSLVKAYLKLVHENVATAR